MSDERPDQVDAPGEVEQATAEVLLFGADGERFEHLARMDDALYDRCRDPIAKTLGIRVTTLDKKRTAVQRQLKDAAKAQRRVASIAEVQPVVAQMNDAHAVVFLGGELRVIWRNHWDGGTPRITTIEALTAYYRKAEANGLNPADLWMDSAERAEFDRIGFEPGNTDQRLFNLWRGWQLTPKAGDCSLILEHIRSTVCNRDEELFRYTIAWLADIAQHPGDPKGTSIAMRGDEGVGKGAFWRYLAATFAPYALQLISSAQFLGRFNDHLAGKLLVFADEATWAGNLQAVGQLKGLITERRILVERKHQPAFEIDNCARFLFSTNNDWAIPAGPNARRFVMLAIGDHLRDNHAYFDALNREQVNGGAAAFLHYLLNAEIACNLRAAPVTAELATQKLLSLDDVGRFWRMMLSAKCHRLTKGHGDGEHTIEVIFGAAATTLDVFDIYLAYAQAARVRHQSSIDALGRALRTYCPGLKKREARRTDGLSFTGRGPQVYELPALADARREFEKALRQPVEWDDPVEVRRW